jgi:hypothetical protein
VAPPEIIKERVPAVLLRPCPPAWHGTIRTTGDFVERGDTNEAALKVCSAQVEGTRKWDAEQTRP